MKKTLILMGVLSVFSISLVACGNDSKDAVDDSNKPKEEKVKKSSVSFPDSELGKGQIILRTTSGSSENNNIPFEYKDADLLTPQIGFEAWEFDGSKLSYIYIDKVLNSKEQLADVQTSLNLSKNDYKIGKHDVEVVQFDNDKESGKIVTYKKAQYEIKSK
ncbi:hypothetical protein HB825_05405 [Listeria booriae]|uniref:hypothetical protein n=1 Tax=Listeria booriae TaxID=1552123 RepID=UPI0016278DCD|nr:hypothetical protein [Listeria booriae]MBC1524917.1 hypothetical protein [Listeria booriae]MBC6134273.1 hypothetical protein [Listeria booriae]